MQIPVIRALAAAAVLAGGWAAPAVAQSPAEWSQLLERLDRLEKQNLALAEEVRVLKQRVAPASQPAEASAPTLEETVAIHDRRIADLAQEKVEAANRLPIRLTGMALFNTFWNSMSASDFPVTAPLTGRSNAGGTLRQTVIGLEFRGPRTVWGGQVRGSLHMDFFAGTGTSLNSLFRLRTGVLEIDWANTTLSFGQEKPIFAPRDPDSLAQVGVSPLTGAGNLWLWQPQVKLEQRFRFNERTQLRAQAGVFQTSETGAAIPAPFQTTLEASRPAVQGRFELSHTLGDTRRLEIAPGFHASTTHVAGTSVPSNLISLDWFANPWTRLEFSGTVFSGQNLANLGTGLRQGVTVIGPGSAISIHARGGWAQLAVPATSRLTFHLFGGIHDDRDADLRAGAIARNLAWGANFFYRLAPNVLVGLESNQIRTTYLGGPNRLNRHYDLALAYLF